MKGISYEVSFFIKKKLNAKNFRKKTKKITAKVLCKIKN